MDSNTPASLPVYSLIVGAALLYSLSPVALLEDSKATATVASPVTFKGTEDSPLAPTAPATPESEVPALLPSAKASVLAPES